MLSKLVATRLYGEEDPLELDLSENLLILTGDNGAGKTTILNIIFNILNGDFETLYKLDFKQIKLHLDEVQMRNEVFVIRIVVSKIKLKLKISYMLNNQKEYTVVYNSTGFMGDRYEYITNNEKSLSDERLISIEPYSKGEFTIRSSMFLTTLDKLIDEHEELVFIENLKNNVIYFPTYRRIDNDIISLIDQNYPLEDETFTELSRVMKGFPRDKRIVGVNDKDIDILYKNFSKEFSKLNSSGLDTVLREFIQELIQSTYTGKKIGDSKSLYNNGAEQLIELTEQLGIGGIDKNQIKEYFDNQKKAAESLKEFKSVEISLRRGNKKNTKVKESLTDQDKNELFFQAMFSNAKNTNAIMSLINFYDKHMKKVKEKLEPYDYLKETFEDFFRNKINITFEDENLKLNKSFKDLSTGEKQLITIFSYAALMKTEEVYKPLIIIDEPELSLHVSWQLSLLKKLLKIPNVNLIIATHSPYIANSDYEEFIWQVGEIYEN